MTTSSSCLSLALRRGRSLLWQNIHALTRNLSATGPDTFIAVDSIHIGIEVGVGGGIGGQSLG